MYVLTNHFSIQPRYANLHDLREAILFQRFTLSGVGQPDGTHRLECTVMYTTYMHIQYSTVQYSTVQDLPNFFFDPSRSQVM